MRDDATYRRRELRKQDGITVGSVDARRNGDVAIAYLGMHPPVCLREASRMKERVCVITKSGAIEWITYALKLLHVRGDDASSRLKNR